MSERTERQDDSAVGDRAANSENAYLYVVTGDSARVLSLDPHGSVLGRATDPPEADLAVADGRMSRRHGRIARDGTTWHLADLGSRNGGFVEGAVLPPSVTVDLQDGAVIRLGDSIFVFRAGVPADDEGDTAAFPGISRVAREVRRRIRQLAAARGHVLVLGETGTGKERVARAIGAPDPGRPFIPQNCAELSRALSRSELFGHARGAFSGATASKAGLVESAAGGALFLDEIGELPLDIQGDLLRFLEDGSFRPIGVTDLRHSDARVIAATNVDLDEAVRKGQFRRDLLARLRATNPPLELPALRDRREDVLDWARRFMEEAGAAPPSTWNAGAVECLLLYPWPENLRELRGLVRGLVADGVGWPVLSDQLPARLVAHRKHLRARIDAHEVQSREDPTRERIVEVLSGTRGRMRPAAEQLGLDRRKLYRLCESFGIEFESFRGTPSKEDD